MIKAVLRLRRDNDYNYEKIKNSFIPANGEICLVDTAKYGLRAVCGDGVSTFAELQYTDVIVQGYLSNNLFYKDEELTQSILGVESKLYFNILDKTFYYYYDNNYISISNKYIYANEINPGIMKLYSTTGDNTDGTMTQAAISKELNEKVEIALNINEEILIFNTDD